MLDEPKNILGLHPFATKEVERLESGAISEEVSKYRERKLFHEKVGYVEVNEVRKAIAG